MTEATIVIGGGVTQARQPITIELVGVKYAITPPKTLNYMSFVGGATALANTDLVAQMTTGDVSGAEAGVEMIHKWIDMAFDTDADGVKARLIDPKDSLDIGHIAQLMKAVGEVQTGGVPPTQPSA